LVGWQLHEAGVTCIYERDSKMRCFGWGGQHNNAQREEVKATGNLAFADHGLARYGESALDKVSATHLRVADFVLLN
jgi:hypothetical protein